MDLRQREFFPGDRVEAFWEAGCHEKMSWEEGWSRGTVQDQYSIGDGPGDVRYSITWDDGLYTPDYNDHLMTLRPLRHACALPAGWRWDAELHRSMPPPVPCRRPRPRGDVPLLDTAPKWRAGVAGFAPEGRVAADVPAGPPGALMQLPIRGGHAYVIDDFVSGDHCEQLMDLVGDGTGGSTNGWLPVVSDQSAGVPLGKGLLDVAREQPALAVLVAGVAEVVEQLYGPIIRTRMGKKKEGKGKLGRDYYLSYKAGDKIRQHSDLHVDRPYGEQGHLTAILLLRASADLRGGVFRFPLVGYDIAPRPGRLLLFASAFPDGRPRGAAVHEVSPVEQGMRHICAFSYDLEGVRFPNLFSRVPSEHGARYNHYFDDDNHAAG